jgi:hypothetical protein
MKKSVRQAIMPGVQVDSSVQASRNKNLQEIKSINLFLFFKNEKGLTCKM